MRMETGARRIVLISVAPVLLLVVTTLVQGGATEDANTALVQSRATEDAGSKPYQAADPSPVRAADLVGELRRPARAGDELPPGARYPRAVPAPVAGGEMAPEGEPPDALIHAEARLLHSGGGYDTHVVPYRADGAGAQGVCIVSTEELYGEPSITTGCAPLDQVADDGLVLGQYSSETGGRIVGLLPDDLDDAEFESPAAALGARLEPDGNFFQVVDLSEASDEDAVAVFTGSRGSMRIALPLGLVTRSANESHRRLPVDPEVEASG